MSGSNSDGRWRRRAILGGVCVLVLGVYVFMARSGMLESLHSKPGDSYYNLLVQGFRAGQLSLKKEAPPGLTQLADPYDPVANEIYRAPRLHDLSYYNGRLYLYFGVTPALILFWPFTALTGQYLFHREAVMLFCAIGFLIGTGLLHALWRRYFADVNICVVAAGALALGLASGVPMLLAQADVYEVAISCAFMLTMATLALIWRALHDSERAARWLAAASVGYGLAVAARPSLLFGAVVLLVPVLGAARKMRLLLAGFGPMILIGLGVMFYNFQRFDDPFEFGLRYQLGAYRQVEQQFFSLDYLWFNLRVYFWEPVPWDGRFPFVREISAPAAPAGHGSVTEPFGVLTSIPIVWLALVAPLAWQNQPGAVAAILRRFAIAAGLLFGVSALTVGLYWWVNFRYQVDFLPALLVLAALGIFGLERALASWPKWRNAARCGWGILLGFSVAFNLLVSVAHGAAVHNNTGIAFAQLGRFPEAVEQFERALRIRPDYAEARFNLGGALAQSGRMAEAIVELERAVRLKPDDALMRYSLARVLEQAGREREAGEQYELTLRQKPDLVEAQVGLARLRNRR